MGTNASVDSTAEAVYGRLSRDQKTAVRYVIQNGWTERGKENDYNSVMEDIISAAPREDEGFHGQVMSRINELVQRG